MGAESYAADSVELAIWLELPQAQRDRVMSNASSRAIRFFILSTSFHFTVIYKFVLTYKDADFRIKFHLLYVYSQFLFCYNPSRI